MLITNKNVFNETELRKILKALIIYHTKECEYDEEEEVENIICKISQELKGE